MNILWVTNIPLKEFSTLLNLPINNNGGWLVTSSKKLSQVEGINLFICFPLKGINKLLQVKGEKITYFAFPSFPNYQKVNDNSNFNKIIDLVNPKIVHLHGTEFPHTLAFITLCSDKGIQSVTSIQGLISVYSLHYLSNLPKSIRKIVTIKSFIKRESILELQQKYSKVGNFEIESLQLSNNVIGRTDWDYACVKQINPNLKYFHCNETLREEFYNHQWEISKVVKFSLFVSQATYSIKGFHNVLEAASIIVKRYPKLVIYVAGDNITKTTTLADKLKLSVYGKYIKKLIKKYDLTSNVYFLGPLNESDILKTYLKSHLFISASSIENSSNSIGEAMLLGVPVISSFVGGVPSLLIHNHEGFLYQYDAPYMLAHYVMELFSNDDLAIKFSINSRIKGHERHDIKKNKKQLISIYEIISNKE
jgi:glycosyltransferase involved in cell wall biosynthesis